MPLKMLLHSHPLSPLSVADKRHPLLKLRHGSTLPTPVSFPSAMTQQPMTRLMCCQAPRPTGRPSHNVSKQRISTLSASALAGPPPTPSVLQGLLRSGKPNLQEHGSRAARYQKGHHPM